MSSVFYRFCGQLGLNDNNKYIVKDYVAGEPTMMMVRLVTKTKTSSTYNYLFKMAIAALPSGNLIFYWLFWILQLCTIHELYT